MIAPAKSSYDSIAGLYHSLWANWYLPATRPALEKLFFSQIATGATVLDLCCGSGHVTKELVKRGYNVTGVDLSAELISFARADLPGICFLLQDARELTLPNNFDGVLSTFDSLNHILDLTELFQVFQRVPHHLRPDGLFVFDMNSEEAYFADLKQWAVTRDDQNVSLVRGTFDPAKKLAATELIWFHKQSEGPLWELSQSVVEQRCYLQDSIVLALTDAGFTRVEAVKAKDAGVDAELGFGRIFYSARP